MVLLQAPAPLLFQKGNLGYLLSFLATSSTRVPDTTPKYSHLTQYPGTMILALLRDLMPILPSIHPLWRMHRLLLSRLLFIIFQLPCWPSHFPFSIHYKTHLLDHLVATLDNSYQYGLDVSDPALSFSHNHTTLHNGTATEQPSAAGAGTDTNAEAAATTNNQLGKQDHRPFLF